jgi:predicted ATP-grasp superfamily ATP-dependent carboligase
MARLAVAALSARWLAQSARRGGWEPIALDLFGDLDTRAAARAWLPIGAAASLRIDAARLRAALRRLARSCAGWIAGPGCEPLLPALGAAAVPPLFGNDAEATRGVRDPRRFFALLAAQGIEFPEVAWQMPADRRGWLCKDADGCGGRHIRPAIEIDAPPAGAYFQRRADGVPASALFVADGRRAVLLACSEQLIASHGGHPYVYCGAVGPIELAPALQRRLQGALGALVAATGLRGLGSLDFLYDGARLLVLEVNPRPSASMALYDDDYPHGLLRAHVAACRDGELTAPRRARVARGERVVFARSSLRLGAADVRRLLAAGCHDVPRPGTPVAAGAPLCSVTARGARAADVKAQLQRRALGVLRSLEGDGDAHRRAA